MSLVIAAIYAGGILCASDSFAFNNDADLTLKHSEFDKFFIDHRKPAVYTAVGSRWVFSQFAAWMKEQHSCPDSTQIAVRWKELNEFWVTERRHEIETTENTALREVSNSLLLVCRQDAIHRIGIIDHTGNQTDTPSFVMSGTGAMLARYWMKETGHTFSPSDSLSDATHCLLDCYRIASHDLYTSGFPAIAVITARDIYDGSAICANQYDHGMAMIYQQVQLEIERSITNAR